MTDTIESLRARLVEVERERDAALVSSGDAILRAAEEVKGWREARRVEEERYHAEKIRSHEALAACAEMRVAGDRLHDDLVLYHPQADVIPAWNALRARTDLGRGMVAVPRETLDSARHWIAERLTPSTGIGAKIVADLDALLIPGKDTP